MHITMHSGGVLLSRPYWNETVFSHPSRKQRGEDGAPDAMLKGRISNALLLWLSYWNNAARYNFVSIMCQVEMRISRIASPFLFRAKLTCGLSIEARVSKGILSLLDLNIDEDEDTAIPIQSEGHVQLHVQLL